MEKIKKQHVIGAVFTIVVGTLLHFAYQASDGNVIVGAFSPVNESVWEHLKLLFYPFLAFALFEYFSYGRSTKNFLPAKVFSVIAGMLMTITVFYTYSGILGKHCLILDILTFVISVVTAYILSYKILNSNKYSSKEACLAAWILLVATIAAFTVFTFRPPMIGLFDDPLKVEVFI